MASAADSLFSSESPERESSSFPMMEPNASASMPARPLGVAVGGEGANELAAAALGGKRRLGLGGGIAAVHVVEEVLHRSISASAGVFSAAES